MQMCLHSPLSIHLKKYSFHLKCQSLDHYPSEHWWFFFNQESGLFSTGNCEWLKTVGLCVRYLIVWASSLRKNSKWTSLSFRNIWDKHPIWLTKGFTKNVFISLILMTNWKGTNIKGCSWAKWYCIKVCCGESGSGDHAFPLSRYYWSSRVYPGWCWERHSWAMGEIVYTDIH